MLYYIGDECTTINEDCDCTEEKCSPLDNTVCNTQTGACECDENYRYSQSTGECERVTSEYLVILSKALFFFHCNYYDWMVLITTEKKTVYTPILYSCLRMWKLSVQP